MSVGVIWGSRGYEKVVFQFNRGHQTPNFGDPWRKSKSFKILAIDISKSSSPIPI